MKKILNGEYVRVGGENYKIYEHITANNKYIQVILVDPNDNIIKTKDRNEMSDGKVVIPIDDLKIESAFSCYSSCTYNGVEDCGIRIERYKGKDVIMVLPPMTIHNHEEEYGFEKVRIGALPQDYIYMKILNENEVQGLRYEKKPLRGYPFNEKE